MVIKVLVGILFLIVSVVGLFYYSASHAPFGPPNPPIAPTAECVINKNERGTYLITCSQNHASGILYIAHSNENLDKYLGKKLKIQAHYVMNNDGTDAMKTTDQCVAGRCQYIFESKTQSTYAIVIEKITVL